VRRSAGQASIEYVAVLALLVAVLAGAGASVAAPDLPRTLAHHARVALCVVGGDICRSVDARAAGLAPCVVATERRENEAGVTIVLVRAARGGVVQIERRSDGSAWVSKLSGGTLDASAGFSVRLGPVLSAGGTISGGYGFRTGRAWEVPDETALKVLLADLDHAPRPTARYVEGGRQTAAELATHVGGKKGKLNLALIEGSVRQALGRRVGQDGTTFYFGFDGGAAGALADFAGIPGGGRWIAEWHVASPPVLTMRTEAPGPKKGQVRESVIRLALGDPADLELAKKLVLLQAAGPMAIALGRRLEQRLAENGSVETAVYSEKTETENFDAGVQVVGGLGADRRESVITRKLVDAYVVRPDYARREDCLGV
jgi:hypothetical protein